MRLTRRAAMPAVNARANEMAAMDAEVAVAAIRVTPVPARHALTCVRTCVLKDAPRVARRVVQTVVVKDAQKIETRVVATRPAMSA